MIKSGALLSVLLVSGLCTTGVAEARCGRASIGIERRIVIENRSRPERNCCGYWILRRAQDSWSRQDRDEWFLIRIESLPGSRAYAGVLVNHGTRPEENGSTVLEFDRVDHEYWGEFFGHRSEPFRMQMHPSRSLLTLETQSGRLYHGERIRPRDLRRYRSAQPHELSSISLSLGYRFFF
jgi:hypothetical protein